MGQCPLCFASISEDDFGLIECGSCSAPLIVHMDGRIEHSGAQVIESAADPDPAPAPEPQVTPDESWLEPPPLPEVPESAMASADLSDIGAFANSELSSGRDGSLRYNVAIAGIDTAEIRLQFREAITDRRMLWDVDQILRSIQNGEVKISNISPVKAYLLILRLRPLPLSISWEQYAISQSSQS